MTGRRGASALGVLIVVGALLRFPTLADQSFWRDEASSALELNGGFGHMFASVRGLEGMPPGYFVLAWLWTRVFGVGEAGLRSLSAVIGLATIGVAYALGCRLSARAGWLAAALAATSPFLVWYAQEARPYALLSLLTATVTLCFVQALDGPARRPLLLWGAAAAGALLTHYFAVFLLVPQALVLLRRHGRRSLAGMVAPVVTGLALAPLLIAQHDNRVDWVSGTPLSTRLADVAKHWASGEFGTPVDAAGALALVLLVAGVLLALARGRAAAAWAVAGTAVAALALPVLLAAVGQDYVLDRYLIAALVPLLALAAAGYAGRGRWGPAAGVALALLFVAFTIDTAADGRLQREDWRAAAARLRAYGEPVTIVATADADRPLRWYVPATHALAFPAVSDDVVLLASWRIGKPRPLTPPPPDPGLTLAERIDAPTYTLLRYRAARPVPIDPVGLRARTLDPTHPPTLLTTASGS